MSTKDPIKNREYVSAWARRHPERHAAAMRRWREKLGPEEARRRDRAYWAVRRALERGELSRGECEMQDEGEGCNGRIHAHHDDYDRPLDVRWFCHRHHLQATRAGQLVKKGRTR